MPVARPQPRPTSDVPRPGGVAPLLWPQPCPDELFVELGRVVHPDAVVGWIAERQHGCASAPQLRWAGLGQTATRHRLRTGRLHRVHRGVYAVGHRSDGPLHVAAAALLACGPRAVLSHWSAAAAWNISAHLTDAVDVSVPRHRGPSREGIRVHRPLSLMSDVRVHRGLPLTNPERTLRDLARRADAGTIERLVAEALALRLVTPTEVEDLTPDGPRLTRSDAERRLLTLLRRAGLPLPETNVRLAGHEVDALWRREGLVVEVDGYAAHAGRHAFERDRRRDQELRAAGYRVERITWRQLEHEPERVVAVIARALAGVV